MVFLGLTSASELAYMSYAYAKIRDRELYQKMTGIIRGSNLLGKCLSSTFAQIAVSYIHIEYGFLVYISLTGVEHLYVLNMYYTSNKNLWLLTCAYVYKPLGLFKRKTALIKYRLLISVIYFMLKFIFMWKYSDNVYCVNLLQYYVI